VNCGTTPTINGCTLLSGAAITAWGWAKRANNVHISHDNLQKRESDMRVIFSEKSDGNTELPQLAGEPKKTVSFIRSLQIVDLIVHQSE
jgi:hypothetical protein